MEFKTGDTVIVGLDGGFESAVAAYLLKKQGLNCIGVAVIYHENDVDDFKDLLSAWLPDELEYIKTICNTLEIPFYATNASPLYQQEVVDNIVAARLTGFSYDPNVDRSYVVLKTLIDKMDELGAKFVATGHLAKILKNQTTGMLNVYTANDLEEDDSYNISKMPYEYLEKLYFPLSEIKVEEISKISKLIPIEFRLNSKERREKRNSLMYSEELNPFVEKYSAKTLRKPGTVFNHYDTATIGDHEGIHQFFVGQNKVPLKNNALADKDLEVLRVVASTGMVYMAKTENLKFQIAYLINFITDNNLNRSLPITSYAMLGARRELLECNVTFKNNGNVLLEFKNDIPGQCIRGQYVVLYNKKGIGRRIIGGGKVRFSGYYEDDEFRTLPKDKEEDDENIENNVQKKKDLGF